MKTSRAVLFFTSIILLLTILVNTTSCAFGVHAENLMENITPNQVTPLDDLSAGNAAFTDFAIRLLQNCQNGSENTLISPLSVLCSLAMTANGASSQTLEQMESVFGMSANELSHYLYSYQNSLPKEKHKMSVANSIWFTDDTRFTVEQKFLQVNADYFDAYIYKTALNDRACKLINEWVNENTDSMIPKIIDTMPNNAVMCLINALAFESTWASVYKDNQVRESTFTTEDGVKQTADFMYSTENKYLFDDNATGFVKYFTNKEYAFVALLPNEGVSVSEYLATLDGESIASLLEHPNQTIVETSIPEFETSYSSDISEVLADMGMPLAFDAQNADFSKLGSSSQANIFISEVLHKTYITVGPMGVRAGAATAVVMTEGLEPQSKKQVYLDRPFVYMLIDCQNNNPFFIGTMMDVEGR